MKILRLTLRKIPYDVMVTGEKTFELRKSSKWIMSRLVNKDGSDKEYDLVAFKNGYRKDSPCFYTEYKGFYEWKDLTQHQKFSNGLVVRITARDIIIKLGKVVEYNEDSNRTTA